MIDFKDFLEESDSLSGYNKHKVQVTASKDGGAKQKINVKVFANSQAEAKGKARLHLKSKGYETHSATHHGIDHDWLKKEEALCPTCGMDPCQCGEVVAEDAKQIDELKLHFAADDANNTVNAKKMVAHLKKRGISASHQSGSEHRAVVNVDTKNSSDKAYVKNKVKDRYDVDVREEVEQIDELSNDTLSSYKKKAGEAATAADKAGKYDVGHKRFKGIVKATFKQFVNDMKK